MKHTSKKTMALAVALLFAVVAMVPVASAGTPKKPADPDDSGDISRTFPFLALTRFETKPYVDNNGDTQDGGIGWYDQTDPNNFCLPFRVLGFSLNAGGAFYYETLRIYSNLHKHVHEDPGQPLQKVPCPIDPKAKDAIVVPGSNLWTGWYMPQDTLLCTQAVDRACFVDPAKWDWDVFACKESSIAYNAPSDPTKSAFWEPLTMTLLAGSASVNCADNQRNSEGDMDPDRVFHWHDVTDKLDPGTITDGSFGSGFDAVPMGHVVHPGKGDAVVISCVNVDNDGVTEIDVFGNTMRRNSSTHDWFYVVDRAIPNDLDQVPNDKRTQGLLSFLGQAADGRLAQGLYDLSGKNGCPFLDVDCDQEDKKPLPDGNKPEKDDSCGFKKDENGDRVKKGTDPKEA